MTHEEMQNLAALDAIGAASPEEVAELRRHLATCEECRRVADEMNESAAMLALTADPVAPPPNVKQNLLQSLPRRAPLPVWWIAAAAVLLVVWGATWIELRRTREEMAKLQTERARLSATVAALGNAKVIHLAGQEIAPRANASVFLDPSQRRAFVFMHDLPPNGGDKSYQLWIIRADQVKPQSAGVFNVDANGNASIVVQNLPVETVIKAVAVTLEPRGGVPAPTGQKFLVGS